MRFINFLKPVSYLILFTLFFLISCPVKAQQPVSFSEKVSKAEAQKWKEDLRYMAEQMPKVHHNLFHTMTRNQFETAVKKLDEQIPTLSRHEIIIKIARIVAMAKDGHTFIGRFQDFPDSGRFLNFPGWDFRSYPITLRLFDDGMFVEATDPRYADAVGGRVLKIGKVSTEKAMEKVEEIVFRDRNNDMHVKLRGPDLLVTPEVLHALGLIDDMNKVQFVVEKRRQQIILELEPFMRPKPEGRLELNRRKPKGWIDIRDNAKTSTPLWLKDPENPYWFEYLKDSHTVYFQFNGVRNKEKGESLEEFAARLKKFIETNPVERLIIDLRWNGGGNNYLLKPLLLTIIKSEKIDQPDKLFAIIGRRTFSAAQNFVNELEKYTNVIFVGEPTAQNVNFYGDAGMIKLPNSGLRVRPSTLWWQNMDQRDKRQWTTPQIAVGLTSEDYRMGRDPALELILNYKPEFSRDFFATEIFRCFRNFDSSHILSSLNAKRRVRYKLLRQFLRHSNCF